MGPGDCDQRRAARVGLSDLEGADADVEAPGVRLLLDEACGGEGLQQPKRDRLLQPCPTLDVGQAEGRALLGQQAQDGERPVDGLDALATILVFRNAVRRSDDCGR